VALPGWTKTTNNVTFNTNDKISIPFNIAAILNTAQNARVCLTATALNFTPTIPLLSTQNACFNIQSNSQTANVTIDLPECSRTFANPYSIRVIASVDVCPQPSVDTILVNIFVNPVPIKKPVIYLPITNNKKVDTVSVFRGQNFLLNTYALDSNKKSLSFKVEQFNLPGLAGPVVLNANGSDSVGIVTNWIAECPAPNRGIYYRITAKSTVCDVTNTDTTILFMKVVDPAFNPPIAYTTLRGTRKALDTVIVEAGQVVNFSAFGQDTARRYVVMKMVGSNFPDQVNNGLLKADSNGVGIVSIPFTYRTTCQDLNNLSKVMLMVTNRSCDTLGYDTIQVIIKTIPPPDGLPTISLSVPPSRLKQNTVYLQAGDVLNFDANGFSPNKLNTRVIAEGTGFTQQQFNGIFAQTTGFGSATLPIQYIARCEDIGNTNLQTLKFKVVNDPCQIDQYDSISINIVVLDTNKAPDMSVEVLEPQQEVIVGVNKIVDRSIYVKNRLSLVLKVTNADSSLLKLRLSGPETTLNRLGIFSSEITGYKSIEYPLIITPDCNLLGVKQQEEFRFKALLIDSICAPGYRDSLLFRLFVFD
jgi:hypothetical protein